MAGPDRRAAALAVFGIAANVAMTLTPTVVDAGLAALSLRGAFWLAGALSSLAAVLAMGACYNAEVGKRGLRLRSLLRVPSDLYSAMAAAGRLRLRQHPARRNMEIAVSNRAGGPESAGGRRHEHGR